VPTSFSRSLRKATPEVYAGRRLHRSGSHKIAGGVAGGLAEHLNVPVLWVRAAFTLLTAIGYIGPLAYVLLWMFAGQAKPEGLPSISSPLRP